MGQQNQEQPAQSQSQQRKGPAALALSCISASAAELATYPIDAIKTQLQLKHSTAPTAFGSSTKPAGALQLARRLVLQGNGLSGLYAGLTPAVLRHFIYTGENVFCFTCLCATYACMLP
jgi:solute carrier family 25 uncoupling protein 27